MLRAISISIALLGLTVLPVEGLTMSKSVFAADDHNDALSAIKRGEILSYAQIRRRVQSQIGGRIVGEKLRRTNRGWVYELRVRQDKGKVIFAVVDAKSGSIIRRK